MSNQAPKTLSKIAVGFALIVVMVGAYTRLVDAGLGCPDWPGCYGKVTVPDTVEEIAQAEALYPEIPVEKPKAWTEMFHRYIAGILGLMVLGLAYQAWRRRFYSQTPYKHSLFLLGLIIFQAALGMWTVTLSLLPVIVMAHLMGGMATLTLLWLLMLRWNTNRRHTPRVPQGLKTWGTAALVMVIVQIMLGGWTTANYAAVACPDFPVCQGQWLPKLDMVTAFDFIHPLGINYQGGVLDNDARVTIHFAHRVGAILSLLIVGGFALQLLFGRHNHYRQMGAILFFVLSVQLLLGVSNVLWHIPLGVAVAHNGVAGILLITVATLRYKFSRAAVGM